ncbi:MAG: hypothetical protein HYZ09_02935 [Candidatus Kerfeldbacteria bacterium]|nr:hypothetical protein [Candidatus Kerfeldbacteria bacterium]
MMSSAITNRFATTSFRATARRSGVAALQQPRWALVLLAIGLAMAVVYLLLVNHTATSGLAMETLESEIASLEEETRQLEIDLANLQSFATIERTGQALDLTEVVTPEFLVAPGDTFAVR